MYRCNGCGRTFGKMEERSARCPACGSRILFKVRPNIVRRVAAR
ncbi:MAG: DNA-directed RNA polymerase subunit P [Hadesarchaea archaeon]|nr:DNA-directed RNA polymerase subunit P [Hadesarchaea archaeon]